MNDAIARSLLAKQIFNGARLYMQGMKLFSEQARSVNQEIGAARGETIEPEDKR